MRSSAKRVGRLGQSVRALLLRQHPESLLARPNSYEPTVAESVAMVLLELDRIAAGSPTGAASLPPFASEFLNRRLARRLLARYPAAQLASEFERRLAHTFECLTSRPPHGANGGELTKVEGLLIELEATLLQAPRATH